MVLQRLIYPIFGQPRQVGVMIMNALVVHNLVHYLNRNVINSHAAVEQLKTLRIKYVIIPAQLCSEARYSVLCLGVHQGKIRTKITSLLRDIARIPHHLFNPTKAD